MEVSVLMWLLSLCSSVLPDEFRLVHGRSRCAGKLEIRTQGRWKQVEDLELAWNHTSAAEVCRLLDCGSLVSMKRFDDYDNWSDFILEITCSDTIRLVSATSLCSGRLEVRSDQLNQSWISVIEDGFDQKDAEVVCRELNCGPLSVLQGELFKEAGSSVITKSFTCQGVEATLSDCFSSFSNYSGKAAVLTCSELKDIRLVGRSSQCSGTLEMKLRGEWKRVYKRIWTLKFAGEVCQLLDCGSPLSVTRRMITDPRVLWELRDCGGPSLTECIKGIVQSDHVTEMRCSDSVRLVNGSDHCSGTLEVKLNGAWSPACDDGFSQRVAEVACREIGCGPTSVAKESHREADAQIFREEVHCGGQESSLLNCRTSWPNPCPSGSSAVTLTCSDAEIRMVGATGRCTGVLEIKQFGSWRPAGNSDAIPDWTLADNVCQRLDCGSCVYRRIYLELRKTSVSVIDFKCISSLDCIKIEHHENIHRVQINCSDSVRLRNGSSECSGRLEVNNNGSWSPVCKKDFDQQDAQVACREIGCGPPVNLQGALFGGVEAPIRTKQFQCEGNESTLLDCRTSSSARNTCSRKNLVGLICSDYLRLVGANSRCAGTLEMLNSGDWRPVADQFDLVDPRLTASVCTELGCGTVVSAQSKEESGERNVWWIDSICLQSSAELRHCLVLNNALKDSSLEVICSDFIAKPDISLFFDPGEARAATSHKFDVPIGSDFGIMCSIKQQYQHGSFELVSNSSTSTQSSTLPAANNFSLFLFSAAKHSHQRTYRCIYHVHVLSHNFSVGSRPISITVSAGSVSLSYSDLIIRTLVVLMGIILSIAMIHRYFKVSSRKMSRPEKNPDPKDCGTKYYLRVATKDSRNK